MSYLASLPLELSIIIWKLVYQESVDVIETSKLVWFRKTVPIVQESRYCVKSHGEYFWYINDVDMYQFECMGFDEFDMVFSNIVLWGENHENNYRSWLVQVNNQWYISWSYETVFREIMSEQGGSQSHKYLANQPIYLPCTVFVCKQTKSTPWWEARVYWKECFQCTLDRIAHQSMHPIVSKQHPPHWMLFD